MESVLATRPPVETLAPGAKRMPLGLTRNTWPFALRPPKICDGLLPSTRFSATEETEGCWKLTCAPAPIEKLCQLRIALSEPWWICMFPGEEEMVACPATTSPPVGSVCASAHG